MFIFKKKKNELIRTNFINSVDSNKIWSKSMNLEEVKELLEHLKTEIFKHEFHPDKNFIMNARRKGLKTMIENRLSKKSENTQEKILESLFNFWEFVNDEYPGNPTLIAKDLGLSEKDLIDIDNQYRKKGIICLQEKNIILEMIQIMEDYINKR